MKTDDMNIEIVMKQYEQERHRNYECKVKITQLSDIITELKSKNYKLEKENSESRHINSLLMDDNSKYQLEIRELKVMVNRLENKLNEVYGHDFISNTSNSSVGGNTDSSQGHSHHHHSNMKLLVNQKDELLRKYNDMSNQLETLRSQYSNTLTRHRDEVNQAKEAEIQLNDESERLTQELKQLRIQLSQVESDKKRIEKSYKRDMNESTSTINSLKAELERSRSEYQAILESKEELNREKMELEESNREVKIKLYRLEETFKATASNSQMKNQNDYSQYDMKCNRLENEKKMLLHDLEDQREKQNQLNEDMMKYKERYKQLQRDYHSKDSLVDSLQSSLSKLESDYKSLTTREVELNSQLMEERNRSQAFQLQIQSWDDGKLREEIGKVDDYKKELQQKLERINILQKQYDDILTQYNSFVSSFEVIQHHHEQLSMDYEETCKKLENIQSQLSTSQSQYNILSKTKLQNDNEISQLKQQILSLDIYKKDSLKLLEESNKKHNDSIQECNHMKNVVETLQLENEKLQESIKTYQKNIASKEDQIVRVNYENGDLKERMDAERRRLQRHVVSVEENEQKLQQQVELLKVELDRITESQQKAYSFLQSSSNQSIKDLMEELKVMDDLVQSERQKYIRDTSQLQQQYEDIKQKYQQMECEFNDINHKYMQEKNSSAIKLLSLQQDYEKISSETSQKDLIVRELISDRDSLKEKWKTIKNENRLVQEKLRLLESIQNKDLGESRRESRRESQSQLQTSKDFEKNMESTDSINFKDMMDTMVYDRKSKENTPINGKINTTSHKNKPVKNEENGENEDEEEEEDSDIESFISRTQKFLERKKKAITSLIEKDKEKVNETMSKISMNIKPDNDAMTHKDRAEATLALISSVYEKQQNSVLNLQSKSSDQYNDKSKDGKDKDDKDIKAIPIHRPIEEVEQSSPSPSKQSDIKTSNRFRDKLSRSIVAAGKILK